MATVARDLGWEVSGSCRSADKASALCAVGIDTYTFDLDESYEGLMVQGLAALKTATHVLATVPPIADFDRDPLLALHHDALLDSADVSAAAAQCQNPLSP